MRGAAIFVLVVWQVFAAAYIATTGPWWMSGVAVLVCAATLPVLERGTR